MTDFLQRLSPRDRRILLWAVPLILLLVVLLATRSLVAERREAAAGLERVLEDIAWLQAQRDALAGAQTGCVPGTWTETTPENLAAGFGVRFSRAPAGGPAVSLTLEAVHGNRVIAFLRELECQGARMEMLELDTVDDQGTVTGRVRLQTPVT